MPEGHTAEMSKLGLSIPYGIDLSPQLDVVGVICRQMIVQLQGDMTVMQCTGTHVCVIVPKLVGTLGGQLSVVHAATFRFKHSLYVPL
jgi:hypothetical protein